VAYSVKEVCLAYILQLCAEICLLLLCAADPTDPDGMTAAVADFGLSRALAFGQVRFSKILSVSLLPAAAATTA
jgi:hypothetical protein